MSQHFHSKLEMKLERYKKLHKKIAGSIERVVNNEILEKNRENIVQTLEGLNSIRSSFQNEFRNITIELHKDLLAHFENFQPDTGFNQLHERYLTFIEKLNEKHLAMTSECDEIVSKIEEIYKKKIGDLKEAERQLSETKKEMQQDELSDKRSPAKADKDPDSPASANPILSREHSSHQHQRKPSQAGQTDSKGGIFGKVKSLLKSKTQKDDGVVRTEMKLGEEAKFKWDPVKKKYVFEGEEDQPEEDVPLPPKKMEKTEEKKKEETPAKEPEQEKAQLGMKDMLKPHTSNVGFLRKRQAPGGTKQPGGPMKPLNLFVPAATQNQDVYNSEPSSSVLQEKKQPLCVQMFSDLEKLLNKLAIKNISSASYLQPLNEIIALAKEDAAHLEEHQNELQAYKLETEKAQQTIKTYEIFNNIKDEAIKKLMESERQATEKLLALEMEKEALKSSLELYKDLLHSKSVSTADEDEESEQKPQYQSMVQEGHFESLLKELSMQEKVIQLSDEVNNLKLKECELESKAKLAEEKAEIYRKRLEEREKEFKDIQLLFDDNHEKDEASLRLMQRAYELGQKVEDRGKKIQELNKLCQQISEEVGEKNSYISELTAKVKRAETRVSEKEGIISEQLETIRSLEDSLAAVEKERAESVSLQAECSELQRNLERVNKELSTAQKNLEKATADASTQNKKFEEIKQKLEAEQKEKENLLKEIEAQKTRVLSSAVLGAFEKNLNEFSEILQISEGQVALEGLNSEDAFEKIFKTLSSFQNKVKGLLEEHNVEKSSLVEEIEALRMSIDEEKEKHKQTQSNFSEEINELKKELEYAASQARQSSRAREEYEELSAKHEEVVKENAALVSKHQALLESFADNLKQQMRLSLKHRLIKDAYGKLQEAHTKAAETWQNSQAETQTAFDELKAAYDELRDSYDENQGAYEELKKSYIELRDSYEDQHKVYQDLQNAYNEAHQNYDNLRQAYDQLGQAYEGLKVTYDSLEGEYQTLNQKYENLKSSDDNEKVSQGNLYSNLQKERDELKAAYDNLENTNKQLQESFELLKAEKGETELGLRSEIEELNGRVVELQANFENLSEDYQRLNQKGPAETDAELQNLRQELAQAIADRDAANYNLQELKNTLETQINVLQEENEKLQGENSHLQSELRLRATQIEENLTNLKSVKHDQEDGLKFEQENRVKLQESLNLLEIEHDQLKLKYNELLNQKQQESGFSGHVLDTVTQYYKEFVGEDVPADQGEIVLRLLEQLRKTGGAQGSDKDEELRNLTSRFEELQNENHRLLDTIALLEGEKGESHEISNLQSLLEKKTKRVDELNNIIEEKNKEIERLKQNAGSPTQNKQPEASSGAGNEGLAKEIEKLKAENEQLKKQLEDQADENEVLEKKLKLIRQEIDIVKLGHNEEIELLTQQIKKKEETEALLRKQLLDNKILEPAVQVIEKKISSDFKSKLPEDPVIIGKRGGESPECGAKKNEEVRKSQGGGFLKGVASFFLTENEKKKLIQE